MMVETILESSQDFGMSNGTLPQWKRELLQRRAARIRPPPPALPAQPAPRAAAADDEDEELRYGPGIVKRLKSRYLSLALRDAPRRRPSVLRRAASLEHLLEPPPPAPRPAQHLLPVPRRESVKRARSVDALSRLEADPPHAAPAPRTQATPVPSAAPRAPRPPRRPQPLLRDAERPPPDVVRAALRKFEAAPPRRAAPAARLPAVLRRATPEPEPADPATRPVSRAALDSIARAGSSVRYAFPAPRAASHLPPAPAPGRAPRRVGVIRPMPASPLDRSAPTESPPPAAEGEARDRRDSPPSALVEPIPRAPPSEPPPPPPSPPPREETPPPPRLVPQIPKSDPSPKPALGPKPDLPLKPDIPTKPDLLMKPDLILPETKPIIELVPKLESPVKIEIVKNDSGPRVESSPRISETKPAAKSLEAKLTNGHADAERAAPAWLGARRGGGPAPAAGAHSVVFNFVSRREVPDYVENDGVVLRAARRAAFKTQEPGVIVLDNGRVSSALDWESDGEGEGDEGDGRASPVRVRFYNDNVLINGRSSMPQRPNKDRITKLKLQFDESLTRTHEYPSEASLCEDAPAAPASPAPPASPPPPGQHQPQLNCNTHMSSAALSGYAPSKTTPDAFQLGVTRPAVVEPRPHSPESAAAEHAAADVTRWADARELPDLLF